MNSHNKINKFLLLVLISILGLTVSTGQNIITTGGFDTGLENWNIVINASEAGTTFQLVGGEEALTGDSTLKVVHPGIGNKGMWRVSIEYTIQLDSGFTYDLSFLARSTIDKWTGVVITPSNIISEYHYTYPSNIRYGKYTFIWNQPSQQQTLKFWIGYNGDDAANLTEYDFYLDDIQLVKRETIEVTSVNILSDEISLKQGDNKLPDVQTKPYDADALYTWISRDNDVATVANGMINATGEGSTYIVVQSKFFPMVTDSVLVHVDPDVGVNGNIELGDSNWVFMVNASETGTFFEIVTGEEALSGDSTLVLRHAALGAKGMWRAQAQMDIELDSGYIYDVYYKAKSSIEKWTGFLQRPTQTFTDQYFFTTTGEQEYGPFSFIWNKPDAKEHFSWYLGYNGDDFASQAEYNFFIDDVRVIKRPNIDATDIEIVASVTTLDAGTSSVITANILPQDAAQIYQWSVQYDTVIDVNDGEVLAVGGGESYLYAYSPYYNNVIDSVLITVLPDVAINGDVELGDSNWVFIVNESETGSYFEIITGDEAISGDSTIVLRHAGLGAKGMWRAQAQLNFKVDSGYTYDVYYKASCTNEKWTGVLQRPTQTFTDQYFYTTQELKEYGPFSFIWEKPSAEEHLSWYLGYNGDDHAAQAQYDFYIDDVRIIKKPTVEMTGLVINEDGLSVEQGTETQFTTTITPSDAAPIITWSVEKDTVLTVENGLVKAIGDGESYVYASSPYFEGVIDSVLISVFPNVAFNGDVELGWENWTQNINETETGSKFEIVGGDEAISGDSTMVLRHPALGTKGMWRTQVQIDFPLETNNMYKIYYKAKASMDKWTGFVHRPTQTFTDSYFFTGTEVEEYGPFTYFWNGANTTEHVSWWIGYNGDDEVIQADYDFYIDDVRVIKIPKVEAIAMEFSEDTIKFTDGNHYQLVPAFTPANATSILSWTSTDQKVVTVDEDGELNPQGEGIAWVFATAKPWNIKDSVCVMVQEVSLAGISLSPEAVNLSRGQGVPLDVIFYPERPANDKINWYVTNDQVITVDENGKVTGLADGTARVIAVSDMRSLVAEAEITVRSTYTPVSGISLKPIELTIEVGGAPGWVKATVEPVYATNQNIFWSSADTTIAKVDSIGRITAVANGEVLITAETEEGGFSQTVNVTVITRVTKIQTNTRAETIKAGETYQIIANVIPATATDQAILYSSADKDIATVDNSGLITAVATGVTDITVKSKDGGFSIKVRVTVTPATSVLSIEEGKIHIYPVPAGDNLFIESPVKLNTMRIYNLTGQLMKIVSINSERYHLDISDLKHGVYAIEITDDNGNHYIARFTK